MSWLDDARQDVLQRPEWQKMSEAILRSIHSQLQQSRTMFFADLSDTEKRIVCDRAACEVVSRLLCITYQMVH